MKWKIGIIVAIVLDQIAASIHYNAQENLAGQRLVPKVLLTQKGYIQFLKYVVDVPEITDYTFCIWMKSTDLTFNHPLLSYSKHEETRLIRVWVTASGSHINLEILGVPVFSVPVHLKKDKFYHICQSWSSTLARWSLFLNGRLKADGYKPELQNLIIDAGGDVVVGQEYTDFDKGLDDGIEGVISGFNLVLASTFNSIYKRRKFPPLPLEYSPDIFYQALDTSYREKPLGLLLIELSHDCGYLRGAPLRDKVLVSWTKTNVRVFGGAILKVAPPFCRK